MSMLLASDRRRRARWGFDPLAELRILRIANRALGTGMAVEHELMQSGVPVSFEAALLAIGEQEG
jgi:hypothetical protein